MRTERKREIEQKPHGCEFMSKRQQEAWHQLKIRKETGRERSRRGDCNTTGREAPWLIASYCNNYSAHKNRTMPHGSVRQTVRGSALLSIGNLLSSYHDIKLNKWLNDALLVDKTLYQKKVKLLIRLFDLRWETRFSIFSLRTFAKVGPFLGPDETSDETNTKNIFHYSGSNETMQNALAPVV